MKYSHSTEVLPTICRISNSWNVVNIRMLSNANTKFVTSLILKITLCYLGRYLHLTVMHHVSQRCVQCWRRPLHTACQQHARTSSMLTHLTQSTPTWNIYLLIHRAVAQVRWVASQWNKLVLSISDDDCFDIFHHSLRPCTVLKPFDGVRKHLIGNTIVSWFGVSQNVIQTVRCCLPCHHASAAVKG